MCGNRHFFTIIPFFIFLNFKARVFIVKLLFTETEQDKVPAPEVLQLSLDSRKNLQKKKNPYKKTPPPTEMTSDLYFLRFFFFKMTVFSGNL